ncbi:hypothetical protein ACQ858_08210 [Variovorax ureilyticus]|uniref:hypothetical protein n=1 Tax=Variovorax ureilyticus TaxID=1836198 RepID=UPI003D6715D2
MDHEIKTIEDILAAYERCKALHPDHEAACAAAAQSMGITFESVRDAIAMVQGASA